MTKKVFGEAFCEKASMSLIEKCEDCGGIDRIQHPMEYPSDLTAECCENCGTVFRLFTEKGEWINKEDLRKAIDWFEEHWIEMQNAPHHIEENYIYQQFKQKIFGAGSEKEGEESVSSGQLISSSATPSEKPALHNRKKGE